MHLGLPLCTHSSQPHYAGSNHHAPPPALAHLRRCHLAYCQVGPKARALPHTRPTVRPSMANCRAGLSKAPQFTPRAAPQATTNQHNQAIHKVKTPLRRVRQKKHSHYRTALHMLRHKNYTELNMSAGEDPKQYGRKDRRDTCFSTMFVMVSCRLGKTSRAKYHVVVAALMCCISCLSCAAMHILK